MQRFFILAGLLGCVFSAVQAQTDSIFPELTIGEWRQHLPWQRAVSVTGSADKIYFATEFAVVEVDKTDRTPHFLTKVEGLSDVGIRLVRFDRTNNVLLIAYNNSNIDLYYPADERVVNLPFIFRNTNLGGDKRIYDVTFIGRAAYLSTGFGMLKMDLGTAEVEYTIFTSQPIRSFALYNGKFYAGGDTGVFILPENDQNPADFSRWQQPDPALGIPEDQPVNALASFNNKLYMGIADDGLFEFNGDTCILKYADNQTPVKYLSTEGTGLVVGWLKGFNGRVTYLESNNDYNGIDGPCNAFQPLYAVEDGSKRFWYADFQDEFRTFNFKTGECEKFVFNSPYREEVTELAIRNSEVYVATPGQQEDASPGYYPNGLYVFGKNGSWRRINGESHPQFLTENRNRDWSTVALSNTDDKIYIGSMVGGLISMNSDGSEATFQDKTNSALTSAGNSGPETQIRGLAFDEDDNLWMSNYDSGRPIAVRKPDGTIMNFTAPRSVLKQVVIDDNRFKWYVVGFNGGIVVYDSGASLEDETDDRKKLITTENSVLATNSVNCLEVDLDGDVWVGTQAGLYSFECGANVFDATNPCKGTRQIVTVDGFNGYLLQDENIRTIAVDGANRKWIGTENGIFVQSADGRETIERFTATNSPLLSNTINDIAIDPKTGEVWIATSEGIVSVRAGATVGGRVNTRQAYAYPNPVYPGYDGPIAIYGLARDANIKITDIAGHLVYEGTALGGQAIWNGRDYLGRRAASGVYLVFATSDEAFDEPDAIITKIVIIN